ncbi:transglycosylase domain-containing protein [Pseudomonas aeruginosa]
MRLLKFPWWTCVTLICGVLLSFSGAYLYLSPSLPSVEALRNVQLQILKVLQRGRQAHLRVRRDAPDADPLRRHPAGLHPCPAVRRGRQFRQPLWRRCEKPNARRRCELLKSGHIQTGGSTITMQVAKNYFLTNERSFSRKINEILLALQIERQLTKDRSSSSTSTRSTWATVPMASRLPHQVYYGKPIKDLSLGRDGDDRRPAESALALQPAGQPDPQYGAAQLDPRAHAQARLHRPVTLPGRRRGADHTPPTTCRPPN